MIEVHLTLYREVYPPQSYHWPWEPCEPWEP